MKKFAAAAKKFMKGEEGPTMVEYAIMVGLIAVVSIIIVTNLGTKVSQIFSVISASLAGVS